ncbi:MAG: BT4734/BF3469 family protein [Algoriphagus sp.]|uniref:BT4734/BF3469 family protein n=1 Tax=Algoriphagus sp. TaxID=1872435 RepID=UPI00272F47BC|nr:BT4734/BF3469 family protein [Algoriphagus sp.]MDP2040004.1 BT4734/BF3469 family protein [Algoriphagus sp.]MDP3470927.1 BT4734/BF3469 family protein [Algoriphagus sp.]
MENFLDRKVSVQANTWSTKIGSSTIKEILEIIKSPKFKRVTEFLRETLSKEPEIYKAEKLKLNAVTFTASFIGSRKIDNIDKYNSLIVIDIDKLDNDQILSVYNKLISDKYVYSFWMSPSGRGYKGLVSINFNFDISKYDLTSAHKHAFSILNKYFSDNHNIELDISGSDIPRLCFISYDSELIIKNELCDFTIDKEIELEQKSKNKNTKSKTNRTINNIQNIPGKNNPFHRKEINSIIRFLEKNNKSITGDYYNWYRVAMAISTTFNYDVGLKTFVKLSMLDKDKFNFENCESFLKECYISNKNQIKINTIRYLAEKEGYPLKKLGEESREALS